MSGIPEPPRPHLTKPTSQGWRFWRIAECRTAGFPANLVLAFGAPKIVAAADAVSNFEAQLSALWANARDYVAAGKSGVVQEFDASSADGENMTLRSQQLHHLRKLAKAVHKRRITVELETYLPADLTASIRAISELLVGARNDYECEFRAGSLASIANATELSRNERFREAVTWQTPRVVKNVLDPLQRSTEAEPANARKFVGIIAKYVQRYCTKNDTIGFFGPVGWARICDTKHFVSVKPQNHFLAKRTVYFEDWAIETVAAQLSSDSRLKIWLAPRVLPTVRIEGSALVLAGDIRVPISASERAVLGMCDGNRTAEEIAQLLVANPFGVFCAANDVLDVLERLARNRRIEWSLGVPLFDAFPERYVATFVKNITNNELREFAHRSVAFIDRAKRDIGSSAGDSAPLMSAIDRLNAEFQLEYSVNAVRRPGEAYGGRTLMYEDCVRAMDVALGADFLRGLEPSIELVLTSARWFCGELAKEFKRELNRCFSTVLAHRASQGLRSVDLVSYWHEVQTLFFGESILDTKLLRQELCARWESIIGIDAESGNISVAADAIKHRVENVFRTQHCGWKSACYQSPDIMLALSKNDAPEITQPLFVLGELHIGTNTLLIQSALNQHPDSQALLASVSQDRGVPRVVFALSRAATKQPVRVRKVLQREHDIEVRVGHDVCATAGMKSTALSDFEVADSNGNLIVRSFDGALEFTVLDFFGELMSDFAANLFAMIRARDHQPRICIDRLVIQRESWRFALGEISWYGIANEHLLFLEAHKWRKAHRMPQFVFCKVPWETKPFYVDFASEAYVRLMAKELRAGGVEKSSIERCILFSEMLPQHDECWLKDKDGNRYTSELRLVAVHNDDLAALQATD